MTPKTISQSELSELVASLAASRIHVIAPVRAKDDPNRVDYQQITRLDEAAMNGPLPRRSLKEFFLPATEILLRYQQHKTEVDVQEVRTSFPPQVILGARPCDAAGVEILDKVMGWDYRDELWFARREATTIVSLACPGIDDSCFCTAVGLNPATSKGADVLLIPYDGGYVAQAFTAKGEKLLSTPPLSLKDAANVEKIEAEWRAASEKVIAKLPRLPDTFPEQLAKNFEHDIWKSVALRCHGCGTCAALCPTCHCFDIVDEHQQFDQGVRRRNWDSCQTGKFTLHASNHNPRKTQFERYRQRVMHKFSIYPRRFDNILCTGCGRCSRSCPASMNLPEIVGQLLAIASAEPGGKQ